MPYSSINNLNYCTSSCAFTGFNALPRYRFIDYLYKYKNDKNVYMLLWFTNALYDIIQNNKYSYFDDCLNYDRTFIEKLLKHMFKLCETEIYIKTDIIIYRFIYGDTIKNFSPITPISYDYKHIIKTVDVTNINAIIDYICLMIQQIKTEYRFIIVYTDEDKKLTNSIRSL